MPQIRIALLSDNQNIATMQTAMLRAVGIRELTRLDSIDVMKTALKHFTFDLLIVNEMGGIDAARAAEIFRDEVNAKDPFMISLLVTSRTTRSGIRALIGLGYDDVLRLPFSSDGLLGKIHTMSRRDRVFVRVGGYFGPDRRRLEEGPPVGIGERRVRDRMSGDEIRRESILAQRERMNTRKRQNPSSPDDDASAEVA